MSWYVLAFISVVCTSVGALYQRLAMKEEKSDPVAASIVFQFLVGMLMFVFASTRNFHLPSRDLYPYFLIPGALYAAGTLAFFKAFQYIGAADVAVFTGAGVIVTVIGSMLFLGDRLSMFQLAGILLIISAILLVNVKKNQLKANAGVWLALLGTAAFGLAVVGDTYIIRRYDAVSYLGIIFFIPGILIFLAYMGRTRELLRAFRSVDKNLLIFILLYAVQSVAFYLALQKGALVAQLSAISKSSIILTVFLATVFLNERQNLLRKTGAAVLATAGVLLVTSQ